MCTFRIFLSEFGCHGNSLCSLENSDSILQFVDPNNTAIHGKKFYIFYTELKYVLFWLIFLHKFGCHSNALCSMKNSGSIQYYNPENTII